MEREQSVAMNGEDLYVDVHQETQEIHMFDVYKVSESSNNARSVSIFNTSISSNHDDMCYLFY